MSAKTKIFVEKNLNIILFFLAVILITLYIFEVVIPFVIAFIITYLTNPLKIYLDKYVNETLSSYCQLLLSFYVFYNFGFNFTNSYLSNTKFSFIVARIFRGN